MMSEKEVMYRDERDQGWENESEILGRERERNVSDREKERKKC